MSDRMERLLARLSAGETLGDGDAEALAATTDILTLGMLADEARRRKHGSETTYVRVADVALPLAGGPPNIPPAAREVRVSADAAFLPSSLKALHDVVMAAGTVPVSAFSLAGTAGARARIRAAARGPAPRDPPGRGDVHRRGARRSSSTRRRQPSRPSGRPVSAWPA